MSEAILIAFFLLGFLLGSMSMFSFTIWIANRSIKKSKNKLEALMSKATNLIGGDDKVIVERMAKVKEITLRQLDLQSQVEAPQKNGLDGRNKNALGTEIRALEEEKIAILNSLLNDGHDPVLSLGKPDGSVETVKLSEFLHEQGLLAPQVKSAPKKFGKFVVYSNDDKKKDN